jgi:hypothetical protein
MTSGHYPAECKFYVAEIPAYQAGVKLEFRIERVKWQRKIR